jgi:methyl-accepting chemotaxis protein
MAESSNSSISPSLKGTIIFAAAGLAVFIGVLSIVLYLAVTRVSGDPFTAAIVASGASIVSIMGFGFWLSNKITTSIQKTILTAKSLERGTLTTVQMESGSSETDELLDSLKRISNQVQRTATQIDDIANGNLSLVVRPTSTNDRIGNSMQKLISKISGSFAAEKSFVSLKISLKRLAESTQSVRRGDLTGEINQHFDETREIIITLNVLSNELRDIIKDVRSVTSETKDSAVVLQKNLDQFASEGEIRTIQMLTASSAIEQTPELAKKISKELVDASTTTILSLEQTNANRQIIEQTASTANELGQQVKEATKRVKKLGERSQEMAKVAAAVEDLKQRTNLIALNSSIQATTSGDNNHGFMVVAEEIEKLARRAEFASKQTSALSKSIETEVNEVQSVLETATRDANGIARLALHSSNAIRETEEQMSELSGRHERLGIYSDKLGQTSQESFTIFTEKLVQMQSDIAELNNSAKQSASIAKNMETLAATVANFKIGKLENIPEANANVVDENMIENEYEENSLLDVTQTDYQENSVLIS